MPKLLLVFTGGTISMKHDARQGGAVPALSGREIVALVPGLEQLAEIEVLDVARLPGPHITPAKMWELSELLREQLARPDLAGAVITHGTDTLEEAAYLLDLRHHSSKPVALVGALRNSSELGWDGPANLYGAARTVLDPGAAGQGVLVVLNETVHAAAAVTKADTQALNAFQSPGVGPLARLEPDRVCWLRCDPRRQMLPLAPPGGRVELLKVAAGEDGSLLSCAVAAGVPGVVIEGTGRGNVPPMMLPAIQHALDAGVFVVIATRCFAGRVLDTYGYEGSGRDLRRRGVLFAGSLPGQKARIKLMAVLGHTREPAEVKTLFEDGQYGR